MKKKIFAAAVAFVATMSLATSAFAADPGETNGDAKVEVEVKADEAAKFETDLGLAIEAPAGAFADGAKVTMEADVNPATDVESQTKSVEAAVVKLTKAEGDKAKVTVNTKLAIEFKVDDKNVQPGKAVKVTVAWDGKSNAVAYIDGDKVEFIKLETEGGKATFEASHFSDYYMVEVDESVLADVVGKTADVGENNPGTGIALAVAPAALAVAFVGVTAVISKKKRG